jgi:hypothetical protein
MAESILVATSIRARLAGTNNSWSNRGVSRDKWTAGLSIMEVFSTAQNIYTSQMEYGFLPKLLSPRYRLEQASLSQLVAALPPSNQETYRLHGLLHGSCYLEEQAYYHRQLQEQQYHLQG